MYSSHKVALFGGVTGLAFNPQARWVLASASIPKTNGGRLFLNPVAAETAPEVGGFDKSINQEPIEPGIVIEFSDVSRIDALINSLAHLKSKIEAQADVDAAQSLLSEAINKKMAANMAPVVKQAEAEKAAEPEAAK